jgi:hypothetical protein
VPTAKKKESKARFTSVPDRSPGVSNGVEGFLLATALKLYLGPYEPASVPSAGAALSSWLSERASDTVRVPRPVIEWALAFFATIPERDERGPGAQVSPDVAKAKRFVELGLKKAEAARLAVPGVEDLVIVKDARGESKLRRVPDQELADAPLGARQASRQHRASAFQKPEAAAQKAFRQRKQKP